MRRFVVAAGAVMLALPLAACGADEAPKPVRPVLSVELRAANRSDMPFAGTIEPRFKTDRGFQVSGQIQTFDVDVGDLVKKGQRLAMLDATVYALDVRAKEGDLDKAKAQAENATARVSRTQRLVERKAASEADLELDVRDRDAALAAVQQAEAQLTKAREQLGYTTLLSDEDGVVTETTADVGQTVAPAQKVMTIARLDGPEAVIDVPENLIGAVAPEAAFRVVLQVDPSIVAKGRVREIAPQADEATRTRRVRIALTDAAEAFRLGTTVTATLVDAGPATPVLEVPRSAVLDENGSAYVFVVDSENRKVRRTAVTLEGGDGPQRLVKGGLSEGQRIVTAGVHSLADGQDIKIEGGITP